VSTLGVIALVTWLVGGLAVGIAVEARWPTYGSQTGRGLSVLMMWAFAPLVVVAGVVFGVCWLLGHAVGRVERVRPSREALEQRIRELEDVSLGGMDSASTRKGGRDV
jgi:hypothetical protein